jgi:hypothetical protein
METKFIKINAEKCPFLIERLLGEKDLNLKIYR